MQPSNQYKKLDSSKAIQAIKSLADKWPSTVVAREEIAKFSGGLLKAGTAANLDSAGIGIPGAFRHGRKIAYPVDSAIEFFIARIEEA